MSRVRVIIGISIKMGSLSLAKGTVCVDDIEANSSNIHVALNVERFHLNIGGYAISSEMKWDQP